MTSLEAFILGAVQGLTEFLPVSSSGHLVIFNHILGIEEPPLTFGVLLHMGTLLAVFVAFWDDIVSILKNPLRKLSFLIIVGCIPAGLAGFFLASYFEKAFESLLVVGIGLIFTGIILIVSEFMARRHYGLKQEEETTFSDVIIIGLFQALAIVPGISRSGSTIAAGMIAGMDREFAARYSFLLSIPVIIGAGIFELSEFFIAGIPAESIIPYIIGPLAAALFGYLAIKLVLKLVRRGKLMYFSCYCWILASITLWVYFM